MRIFVSGQKIPWRVKKIRLKQKTLVVFLFMLSLPLATISSATACNAQEVSFYVYLETPEKQVVADSNL